MNDRESIVRRSDLERDPAGVDGDREVEELAAILFGRRERNQLGERRGSVERCAYPTVDRFAPFDVLEESPPILKAPLHRLRTQRACDRNGTVDGRRFGAQRHRLRRGGVAPDWVADTSAAVVAWALRPMKLQHACGVLELSGECHQLDDL
jgi:hypothetical protein